MQKNLINQNVLDIESIFNEHYYDIPILNTHKLIDYFYNLGCETNFKSGLKEIYLSFGLCSCEDGKNSRNNLNLLLLIDMSLSMNEKLTIEKKLSKIEILKNAIC